MTTGEIVDTCPPDTLLSEIAEAAHVCGDPGMQYDTTINRWNPVKNSGRINSSNPCSEYMFLDDTACNLASLNLMTFVDEDGQFDVRGLPASLRADDPRPGDPGRSRRLSDPGDREEQPPVSARWASATRTSGALLMSQGLPYDSDGGRHVAAIHHLTDVRRGLPDQRRGRRGHGPFPALPR